MKQIEGIVNYLQRQQEGYNDILLIVIPFL